MGRQWTEGEQGPFLHPVHERYEGEGLVYRDNDGNWWLKYDPPQTSIFYSLPLPAEKPEGLPDDPQKWFGFLVVWGRDHEPQQEWFQRLSGEIEARSSDSIIYNEDWGRLAHLLQRNFVKRCFVWVMQRIVESRRCRRREFRRRLMREIIGQ